MSIHKIGELVVRSKYHKKWNKKCDTFGTITSFDPDTLYYTIWWWDNFIMTKKPHTYLSRDIFEFKNNLKSFLDTEQNNE